MKMLEAPRKIGFRAMGSGIGLVVEGDGRVVSELEKTVPQWFQEWESVLSRFLPTSELCALNASSAADVAVSETLYRAVEAALAAAQLSEGLVTPTTLAALERAGYDRSFEKLAGGAVASGAPTTPAEGAPDVRYIRLDESTKTVHRPVGVRLDLGGSAKGWAADQTVARLAGRVHALIDAGGDIAVTGPRRDGMPWPIAVGSPFDPAAHMALVLVSQGGVATSGRDFRRWHKDGKLQHHLIDPRTGEPAATDLMSVTVVGPSAREAEAVSKAVLVRGSEEGMAWLESKEAFAGLLVREDRTVLKSSRMGRYLAQ
jgi:thiamine biosynthesis lipoprotein